MGNSMNTHQRRINIVSVIVLLGLLTFSAIVPRVSRVSALSGTCRPRGHLSNGLICLPSSDNKTLVWQAIPREGKKCLLPRVMYGSLACTRVNGRPIWKDMIPKTGYSWKITPRSTDSVLPAVVKEIRIALKRFENAKTFFDIAYFTYQGDLARTAAKYKVRIKEVSSISDNYPTFYKITTVVGSTCIGRSNIRSGATSAVLLDSLNCSTGEPLVPTTDPPDLSQEE